MRVCPECGIKIGDLECFVGVNGKVNCPKCGAETEKLMVKLRRLNVLQMKKDEENR